MNRTTTYRLLGIPFWTVEHHEWWELNPTDAPRTYDALPETGSAASDWQEMPETAPAPKRRGGRPKGSKNGAKTRTLPATTQKAIDAIAQITPAKTGRRPWTRVSDSERADMARLRGEGKTFAAIGLLLGRDPGVVRKALATPATEQTSRPKRTRRPLTPSERATIVKLNGQGIKAPTIARSIGRYESVVYSFLGKSKTANGVSGHA